MRTYEVKSLSGHKMQITAANSTQAKRIYCRKTGRKQSDYWTGISTLKARQIKN